MQQRAQMTEKLQLNLANLWLTDVAMKAGIAEGEDLLVIDLHLCTRCDNCVAACASIHDGETRLIRKGQKLGHFLIPTSCRQCSDPLCMIGCPVSAVVRDMQTGEVEINDRCIGCGHCSHQCPYGNILMVSLTGQAAERAAERAKELALQPADTTSHGLRIREGGGAPSALMPTEIYKAQRKATKCDLCKGLPYAGCVNNCPHGAALRLNARNFLKALAEQYGGG
jgi:Fe-S-cluster-containing hydrogenase component 2